MEQNRSASILEAFEAIESHSTRMSLDVDEKTILWLQSIHNELYHLNEFNKQKQELEAHQSFLRITFPVSIFMFVFALSAIASMILNRRLPIELVSFPFVVLLIIRMLKSPFLIFEQLKVVGKRIKGFSFSKF